MSDAAPASRPRHFLHTVDRVLYPSCFGSTLVILGFQVYEFFQGGAYRPRYPFAEGYLTLLTAYAAQREITKWKGLDEPGLRLRRGELFVAVWIAVWLAMTAIANVTLRVALPVELTKIALGVLLIFTGTGVSSVARQRRSASGTASMGESVDPQRRKSELLDLLKAGPLLAEEAAERLGLPKTTAWRLLEELEREGRITQDAADNSRQRRYRFKA